MNELTLRTTEMFGEVQTDIYENNDNEMFMTSEQLGECLEYSEPTIAINKLVSRHEYLKKSEFSVVTKLVSTDGKRYNTRVFTEDGVYEITMLAKTEKAKEFRHWVRRLIKSLRKGDINLITKAEYTILQNQIIETNKILSKLEAKKPTQPNYWLWKKHIVRPAIENLSEILCIDVRSVFDLVYDSMTANYGFDKSFVMNQFCTKYGVTDVATIDAIADVPEYQKWFIESMNRLISNAKYIPVKDTIVSVKSSYDLHDKVAEVIRPLIKLYDDKSANGAKTYGKVYAAMMSKRTWKSLMTRYKCTNKKQVLMQNEKYFKKFCNCVDNLFDAVLAGGDNIEVE